MWIVQEHQSADALAVLRDGGIVAHATETCYGLACDITNPDAAARLFAIKQRPATQPVSALFASLEDAKRYVVWNDLAEEFAKELPGPVTIVLPMHSKAPHQLFPIPDLRTSSFDLPSLGIRLSPHPLATHLVQEFGSPLTTTSANLHGKPNPYSAQDIIDQYASQNLQPDCIIDSGPLPPSPASRVIDCTGAKPRILRR